MTLLSTESVNPTEVSRIEVVYNALSGTNIWVRYAAAEIMTRATNVRGIDTYVGAREYEMLPVVNDAEEMRGLFDSATRETEIGKPVVQRTLTVGDYMIMTFSYTIRKINDGFHIAGNPEQLTLLTEPQTYSWSSRAYSAVLDFIDSTLSTDTLSTANSHKIICLSKKSLDIVVKCAEFAIVRDT